MKTKPNPLHRQDVRGSAFITVLIFTFILIGIASTLIRWSVAERALNVRNAYWLEARNAAEAVAEFGFSQIATEFSSKSSPPTFDPATTTKLSLPPASFFTGSLVDTAAYSSSHTTGLQLIGGTANTIPATGLYYINPNDPNNRLDPLKGQWVYRRDIQVLARATVVPPTVGQPVTAYVTQTVSVRGAPLFSHAIFYSANDMEIFPGPTMNIYGPVHVNGNLFISSQSSSLNFHGEVSLSGNLYHAWSDSVATSHGTGSETLGQYPVNFTMADGSTLKNLDSSGTTNSNGVSTDWRDSTYGADNGISGLSSLQALVTATTTANFRQFASQNYNGNLQTSAMNIQPYYPLAFNEVIDAAGDTPDPHVLIDPSNANLSTSDPYYDGKSQVEANKMANQSALYIQVDATPATLAANGGQPVYNFYGPPGSAPVGTPANQIGPNGGILLTKPANMTNLASNTANPPLVTYLPFRQLKTVVTKVSSSKYTYAYTVANSAGTTDAALTTAATAALPSQTSSGTAGTSYKVYSDTTNNAGGSSGVGNYAYGMFDQRRSTSGGSDLSSGGVSGSNIGATDVVQIDMKALSSAVGDMASNTTDANSIKTNSGATVWSDSTAWNGAVYVEVKTAQSPTTTPYVSSDYPSTENTQTTSVRLVNGQVASGSSLVPAFGQNGNGLTIATNAPVYVDGNFNADGSNTGTTGVNGAGTLPDDGNNGSSGHPSAESPVCIAGDAVTILSGSWSDTNSLKLNNTATSTEVAAALLVGLQPTTDANNSGGAHNLPRFLENWSGQNATVRGSLATLFSCKIATQPFSGKYYGAPTRNWGFDQIFANGNYPPITPKVMSYRRVLFSSMTSTTYTTAAHSLWPTEF